ncbi:MAG: prepilin peptidase [Bacilli bacterium]|nr:prepilin peptidase [Bacilli bacterium]MDD3895896.1 prepilin peptidase [Bacilli bacterium]MDD4407832.1 prepilin peptidase [Bacilli bacterium]
MIIFIFILGLLLGSFYNVVGIRLLKNESIVKPRSHCPKCQHQLSWYENIPVISYLFLLGKCKNCKQKISLMYPAMELLTAILFMISYLLFGISGEFFIAIILSSLVVLIFITDSKDMIILDEAIIVSGVLIFIIKIIFEGIIAALASISYGFLIFIFIFSFMLFGNFIFKKESLGGGDIKLSFIAGMVLGIPLGIFYVILGSFLAFPYAIYVSIKNEDGILPFGPFLAVSLLLCYCNSDMILEFLKALLNIT